MKMTVMCCMCLLRSEPVVLIEKDIDEGIKVKVVELGLTVVLSPINKIFIKVSAFWIYVSAYRSVSSIDCFFMNYLA